MKNKGVIVVTGGAGYIGSHTIIEIIEHTAFDVVSIDNFSNSQVTVFDRIEEITGKRVVNYAIDLCDRVATFDLFQQLENVVGIIHFAAFKSVPESVANPYKYFHNNFESLSNVLEAANVYGISNFIFSSSCSVYGNIAQLPVAEDTPLSEAESPYAYTKQVGEKMVQTYTTSFEHIRAMALRYFNPVGGHISGKNGELPLARPTNLVPVITQTAIGLNPMMSVFGDDYQTRDGSCIRDYIHVTDIAIAHIRALEVLMGNQQEKYTVINLGSGDGVSVLEAIHAFETTTGQSLNYQVVPKRAGDVEAIYSNTTKSEKVLGWKTKFSLADMMETAWKWENYLKELRSQGKV